MATEKEVQSADEKSLYAVWISRSRPIINGRQQAQSELQSPPDDMKTAYSGLDRLAI